MPSSAKQPHLPLIICATLLALSLNTASARSADHPKLQLGLSSIAEQVRLSGPEAVDLDDRPDLQVNKAGILVEVWLDDMPADIESRLSAAGMKVWKSFSAYQVVTGRVPAERLEAIANLAQVAVVMPVLKPVLNVGAAENQADESIRADLARSMFSTDGSNILVGVLSDSVNDVIGGSITGSGCNRFLSGSDSQNSGDLPAELLVIDGGPGGGTDEGAAMAELIYDIAPGSDLAFHSAFNGEADFADGITELVNCFADIVVDDVIYFAEPMFQDGFVAQAAQGAHDAGVPYFSSAGNNGTTGVNEVFTDVDPATDDTDFDPVSGNDFHQFDGGDEYASVSLPNNCSIKFVLQWNQPYEGSLGPGAITDLDIYACTAKDNSTCDVAFSIGQQGDCSGGASGNPVEIMDLANNTGSSQDYQIAVDHFCGPDGAEVSEDIEFRIVTFESCGSDVNYEADVFDQPQIYGHAAAKDVNGTAAVFYGEIDLGGDVFPPDGVINVEPFSSLGGDLPFYFDGDGNPLAGGVQTRFKPDMAAPDGGNTTFFGFDISFDDDSDPNFFGTSAAAPNAAAVAALMLSSGGLLPSNAVRQVMMQSTFDIESTGTDPLSGPGLIDAVRATQTVTDSGTGCIPVLKLSEQTHTAISYFRACDRIDTDTDFIVADGAMVELETGNGTVRLGPGTRVKIGGQLRISRDGAID